MAAKRAAALCLLILPLVTGMRDPFQPVPDRCLFSQMALWRYQGMVAVNGQRTGVVRDPSGIWRRLREGESLPGKWDVVRLNTEEITLENGDGCSPANWRWKREGAQDDKNYYDHNLPLRGNGERGRKG